MVIYSKQLYSDDHELKCFHEALYHYEKSTGYVEILKDNIRYPIYFPKPDYCLLPNSRIKEEFYFKVKRSNQKTKLEGLVGASSDLINQMKYERALKQYKKFFILAFFARHLQLWRSLLFILVFSFMLLVTISLKRIYYKISSFLQAPKTTTASR